MGFVLFFLNSEKTNSLSLCVAPLCDFNLPSTSPVPNNFCQHCQLHAASINSFSHHTNWPPPSHWHWRLSTLLTLPPKPLLVPCWCFQLKYLYVISLEHHIYCDRHGSSIGVVFGLAFFKNAVIIFSGINHISLHLLNFSFMLLQSHYIIHVIQCHYNYILHF